MTIDKATIRQILVSLLEEADKAVGSNPLYHFGIAALKVLLNDSHLLDATARNFAAKS